jgi:hypothetical protein
MPDCYAKDSQKSLKTEMASPVKAFEAATRRSPPRLLERLLWPEIMARPGPVQPVEVGLATFRSSNGTDYSALAAAGTFTTLPLMIFFLLLQRQFIRGALPAARSIR